MVSETRPRKPFIAAPVPNVGVIDRVQLNWNARQWAELQRAIAVLETRLAALEVPETQQGGTF